MPLMPLIPGIRSAVVLTVSAPGVYGTGPLGPRSLRDETLGCGARSCIRPHEARQRAHRALEVAAALLVAVVPVERRARGRQHDHVTGPGEPGRGGHGLVHRPRTDGRRDATQRA